MSDKDKPRVLLEYYLKRLRLPTILREYASMAEVCSQDRSDFTTYLLRLVEREVLDREKRAGLQVAIHAIEERAVEAACSAIAFALQKLPKPDHRHRIEHSSVCPPALSSRIASLGIYVVTQPAFIFYRGDRYLSTVAEGQRKHLYPIGTWLKKGVCVAGSSDFPISPLNPIAGISSAVSRMTQAGKQVLPEEKISPLEALRLYTQYAARMIFEEDKIGGIAPGKQADLIILDKDPTRQPIHGLLDLKVEMTLMNGEIVWEKSQ